MLVHEHAHVGGALDVRLAAQRSHAAAEKLASLGYSKLYDLGGLGGWPYGLE